MTRAALYGNKHTRIYHAKANNDRCRVSQIKESNRVTFESNDEALAAGFTPCRHCFQEETE